MVAAVSTQEVFAHTEALVEVWDVGANVAKGTLVKQTGSNRYGVTLTPSPGQTGTDDHIVGDWTIKRAKRAGVGNDKVAFATNAAAVATDGTWEFTGVTGVTASTAQGTPIYADAGLVLTTSNSSTTLVGYVNLPASYVRATGKTAIKLIGAN